MKITIYVCPLCQAWAEDTARGHPLHSTCELDGHPQAIPIEFHGDINLINPKRQRSMPHAASE